jgi:hypothetical protein
MNDRLVEFEAAIRAQAALICDAQVEISRDGDPDHMQDPGIKRQSLCRTWP